MARATVWAVEIWSDSRIVSLPASGGTLAAIASPTPICSPTWVEQRAEVERHLATTGGDGVAAAVEEFQQRLRGRRRLASAQSAWNCGVASARSATWGADLC